MVKIDLHTHSIISPDGGISAEQYEEALETGLLDCIAITDHNETAFALKLHQKLGNKIIVGEEIKTTDGEMLGLFLHKTVPPHLSAKDTAEEIHAQGGIVCIPHPLETARKGLNKFVLEELYKQIDLIELFNGRGRFRGRAAEATIVAEKFYIPGVANSDAHAAAGLGTAYTSVLQIPTPQNIKKLAAAASLQKEYAPLWTFLYPTINRMKKKVYGREMQP
jgi:predicted metal-dependent phosphoesterase TrpH